MVISLISTISFGKMSVNLSCAKLPSYDELTICHVSVQKYVFCSMYLDRYSFSKHMHTMATLPDVATLRQNQFTVKLATRVNITMGLMHVSAIFRLFKKMQIRIKDIHKSMIQYKFHDALKHISGSEYASACSPIYFIYVHFTQF